MAAIKEFGRPVSEGTVIGDSILINGRVTGDEDLTIRGRVEGEVSLTRTLIVDPTGVVKATVTVKNAIISGVVVGNVTATESVEITKDGRMVGEINAPRVILVDGASFKGRIEMSGEQARRSEEHPAQRPVIRPQVRAAPPVTKVSAPMPRAVALSVRVSPPAVRPVPTKVVTRTPSGFPALLRPVDKAARVESKSERASEMRPQPPPPPQPVLVAEAGKKKVLVKKKK
jgi:cytoskeletal protein CcmA (bactofilin family)